MNSIHALVFNTDPKALVKGARVRAYVQSLQDFVFGTVTAVMNKNNIRVETDSWGSIVFSPGDLVVVNNKPTKQKHHLYIAIALLVAKESYAKRNKVGAVIVRDNNILSFGYNGTPSGFNNECEIGDITKPEVLHAESNAILKCAKNGTSTDQATLYLSISPCVECCKLIIQAGIKAVYYAEEYRITDGLKLLHEAGISTNRIAL